MWNDLVKGALGALVIVDTRRLDDCYPAVDYFEKVGLPFVIAVNVFDGRLSARPRRRPLGARRRRRHPTDHLRREDEGVCAQRPAHCATHNQGPSSGRGHDEGHLAS